MLFLFEKCIANGAREMDERLSADRRSYQLGIEKTPVFNTQLAT
jgi:hypothetical protein